MDLKKNDKLILIVGVVILIIAAIGVAVYTSPDTDDITAGDTQPELKTYYYSWTRQTGETTVGDDLYTDKNSPYSDSFTITTMTGSILTNAEVVVNWEDDYTHGLMKNKGLDTLTVDIAKKGSQSDQESNVGGGNVTFDFSIFDIPSSDSVVAEDINDAENIIDGLFSNENTESFDFEVSINTGEKIWRLLKFLRDTGNSFELKVLYTYYVYEIDEPEETNDDDKTTDDDGGINTGLGLFYKNLCYGRGMI